MAVGRWIGRTAIAVVALVVLVFVALVAALMLINTETLKGVLEDRVEAATGRQLEIAGPLDVSVFPWLGFELGPTRLANAADFGEQSFASLERAELRVRLLPLLQREVALDTVVLHGLQVNLARNAQGTTNWADLVGEGADAAQPTSGAGAPAPEGDGLAGVSLRVEAIELADAAFSWNDATTGQAFTVRDLDLTTGTLEPNRPTPVRLSVTLEQQGGPTVALDATSALRFDSAARTAALTDLELDIEARGDALPGGQVDGRLEAGVRVDAAAGRAVVAPLELTLLDTLHASGRVESSFGEDVPSFEGALAVAELSPRELLDALGIEPPETADDQALSRAALRFDFSGTPASLRVQGIEGRLDDSRITGGLRAETGTVTSAVFDLGVDAIDVDRYLAAGSRPPAAAIGAGDEEATSDPIASLPLEAMRGVDVEGHVRVGRLGYRGLDATDARLDFRLAGGLLTLERADVKLAGGTLQTRGRLDARGDEPALRLETNVGGVRAEPLLQALAGAAPVVGRLDTTLALDTAGGTLDAWLGALDGRLAATFSEGALEGVNLAQQLRVAAAKLRGDAVDEAQATRRTDFSILRFVGEIRDGVLEARELDLRAPLLRVRGDGRFDLARRELDYTARVLVTGTLAGQGGAAAEQLRGLEVPIRFRGSFTDPSIEVQLAKALERRETGQLRAQQEAAEAEARRDAEQEKQRLERKKREAEQRAKDELEQELKKLFE